MPHPSQNPTPEQIDGMNAIHMGAMYTLTALAHVGEWDEFTRVCKEVPLAAITLYNLADRDWGPYDLAAIHPMGNMLPITINQRVAHAIQTHVETAIPELAATLNPLSDPPMPAKLGGM